MKDLRFVENESKFLEYAWDVYSPYFREKQNFLSQYNRISTQEDKNTFLRVICYYYCFIKIGKYTSLLYSDEELLFVDQTNKFIAIISIIESLYQKNNSDFYQWIMRNRKKGALPINDPETLTALYKQYKDEHGTSLSIVRFFQSLDQRIIAYIQKSFLFYEAPEGTTELDEKEETIEVISRLLYQIRSDYVHQNKLVLEFDPSEVISLRNGRVITCSMKLENLCKIFETGILQSFYLVPDLPQI